MCKVVLAVYVFLVSATPSAAAVQQLDQYYDGPTGLGADVSFRYRAQTFTVGLTGQLTRIEANVWGTGSSVFEIWNTTAGVPATIPGTPLASGTINFNGNGFFGVDISPANLHVNSGDVLAIVQIGANVTSTAQWQGQDPGPYTGGTAFTTLSGDPSGAWVPLTFDFGFKTFVTVPEPGSALLLLAACGAFSVCARP
jgi:hypothetical protein